MAEFALPTFPYDYDLNTELQNIRAHQQHRQIPTKAKNRLLLATWNLCNLGAQDRRAKDLTLMAEILRPFDLIAVQEVRDDFHDFHAIVKAMGKPYRCIMTDRAGNDERLAYIYDSSRVKPRELFGELVLLDQERPTLSFTVNGQPLDQTLDQFNRNPYLASWKVGKFSFTTANVHVYFGDDSGPKFRRRVLEVYALARWAHDRVTKHRDTSNDTDIILIGDMNVPKMAIDDPVFQNLIKFGMKPTKHSTETGTNLAGMNHYDQITFLPSETAENALDQQGVFDFDKGIFTDLWAQTEGQNPSRTVKEFWSYCRYYISDHRPLWCAFKT